MKPMHQWRIEFKQCVATNGDRIALLKKWAGVKLKHKHPHLLADVRAKANRMTRALNPFGNCWACGRHAELFRHHIIQLQHGGTNTHLNIIKICNGCHTQIHPWLRA